MGGGPEGNAMTNQHRAVWRAGEQEDETAAATSLNSLLAPRSELPIKSHPLSRDSFDFFTPVSGTLWNVTTRNRSGSRVGRVNARAPRRPREGAQGQGLGKESTGWNGKPVQNHTEQGQIEGSVAVYIPFPAYLLGATFPQIKKSHLLGSKIKHLYGTSLSFN